ncbi:MAG TPA: App1 family protein [Pyrinomonadaceae bacterium]|nr:App1 family protein [Pyrinomonadaceae bacterium]
MGLVPGFISRFFERKEKHLTVYPTYGYKKPGEDEWTIPLRVWVHKRRSVALELFAHKAVQHFEKDMGEPGKPKPLSGEEKSRLKECLKDFVADDDSFESVEISFDKGPAGGSYRLNARTNFNGLIEEEIKLPAAQAAQLLEAQASGSKWLTLTATSAGFKGTGRVRLLDPQGTSVVSDIDDTIKVTEVPAGKKPVLIKTFLKPFVAVKEMPGRYSELLGGGGDVSFHYVSGSPWQLYRLLSEFLIKESGFPEGTFHLKSMRKNLFDRGAWQDIRNFVLAGDTATLEQKIEQITELMLNLPERKFILIGDSGEKDPEVYRAVTRLFPGRVEKILIRDVLGKRLTVPVADTSRPEGISIELIPVEEPVFLDTEKLAKKIKKDVEERKGITSEAAGAS